MKPAPKEKTMEEQVSELCIIISDLKAITAETQALAKVNGHALDKAKQ